LSAGILTLPNVFKADPGSNLDFGSKRTSGVDVADAVAEALIIGFGGWSCQM
jgi:hypothetical protein